MTIITLVGFFFMSPDVTVKVILPCKAFLTIVTPIWFLFGVSPDVSREVTLLCKTFLAIITLVLVWCLFGVNPGVIVKLILPRKAFLTILTLVAFLFGVMSPDVTVELRLL